PHLCLDHVNVVLLHGQFQAKVTHHGHHQGVVFEHALIFECHGHNRHDLVTVNDGALVIDRQEPIGVAIKCHTEVCTALQHRSLEILHVGRAVILVDVQPIRVSTDHNHFGSGLCEHFWCHPGASTVRGINDDFHAVQTVGHRLQQMQCVTIFRIGKTSYATNFCTDRPTRLVLHLFQDAILL